MLNPILGGTHIDCNVYLNVPFTRQAGTVSYSFIYYHCTFYIVRFNQTVPVRAGTMSYTFIPIISSVTNDSFLPFCIKICTILCTDTCCLGKMQFLGKMCTCFLVNAIAWKIYIFARIFNDQVKRDGSLQDIVFGGSYFNFYLTFYSTLMNSLSFILKETYTHCKKVEKKKRENAQYFATSKTTT